MTSLALTDRYGAPRPWRRRVVIVACAIVVAMFAGWLAWTVYDQTNPRVTSQMQTFTVDGEHAASAVIVVSRANSDVQASCTLRAYAADHSVVGELRFDPADQDRRTQTRDVRTERRATSVELMGCTAPGQPHPR